MLWAIDRRRLLQQILLASSCVLLALVSTDARVFSANTQQSAAFSPQPAAIAKPPSPAATAFARELLDAPDDVARQALLDGRPALVNIELTRALIEEGSRLLREGAFERSLTVLRLARDVAERSHDRAAVAGVTSRIAQALSGLGDNDAALPLLRESLATYRELNNTAALQQVMNNLAIVHRLRGDLDEALAIQRELLKAREASGNTASLALTLNNIGLLQQERGEYRDAVANLQRGLEYRTAGTAEYASSLHNLGDVYHAQGDLTLAQSYYARALEQPEMLALNRMRSLAMLAEVTRKLGQLDAAAKYAEQGVALAERSNAQATLSSNLRVLGLIYSDRGDRAQALTQLERSVTVARATTDAQETGYALATLGSVLIDEQAYARARGAADEAIAFGDALPPLAQVLAYQVAGQAHAGLHHAAEARRALQAAIDRVEDLRAQVSGAAVERQQFLEGHLTPYHALIDLLIQEQQFDEALQYAERARARTLVDVVQRGHVSLARWLTPEERRQERDLERRLGDLQRRQAETRRPVSTNPPGPGTMGQDNNARAVPPQDLADAVAAARRELAALRTQLFAAHPELRLARGAVTVPAAADISRALLDSSTAVLAYTVTGHRVWLFVLTKADGLRVSPISMDVAMLTMRVRRFREALATRELGFASQARALYDDLLGPAAAACNGKTNLILVPDGALWELPFQALQTPARRYLIEDATIAYAPSLTFLYERKVYGDAAPTPMTAATPRRELLAFGNPTLTAADAATFKPLPLAEDQVRRLALLYPPRSTMTLTGAAAQEARAKSDAARYRIVHFATHGVLDDGNPLYSALLLAPDASAGASSANSANSAAAAEDGRLEARELMDIPLTADLVILSACETARGRIGAGEGVVGLSWAILLAGSKSTIVSQWQVEEDSTSRIMMAFHRALRRASVNAKANTRAAASSASVSAVSPSPASALRQASLDVMRSDARYRHPFYWAGFRTVGAATATP